jgi:NADH-quinone oxidoreductase subunit J
MNREIANRVDRRPVRDEEIWSLGDRSAKKHECEVVFFVHCPVFPSFGIGVFPPPCRCRESVSIHVVVFFILAFTGVVSAILVITRRNPVNSALFLIVNFIALSGLYLTLHAQFVAIIQILVYAGAIMVLVLFVIMLLNLQNEERLREKRTWSQYFGVLLTALLLVLIIAPISHIAPYAFTSVSPSAPEIGTVEYLGTILYTSYLFPFEMTSILLLAAMVGAVVLAKKRFP